MAPKSAHSQRFGGPGSTWPPDRWPGGTDAPFQPGGQAGDGAFTDQLALVLGEGREDVKHQPIDHWSYWSQPPALL